MYSRIDLGDVQLPQLPALRLRRRSSVAQRDVLPASRRNEISSRPSTGRAKGTPVSPTGHRAMPLTTMNDSDTPKKSPAIPASFTSSVVKRRSVLPESSTAAAQQYIVDKPPKHMTMHRGDHYHIPVSVTNLRIEMSWDSLEPAPEIGASLFSHSGKRLGFVSATTKVLRPDKSLQYASDDFPGKEVVLASLNALPPETCHLFVEIRANASSKAPSDIDGATIRIYDTSFFPGTPELLCVEVGSHTKVGTIVAVSISKERTVMKGDSVPLTPSQCKTVPREALVHLWTVVALSVAFPARGPKQVLPDIEDLAKRLLSGWTPVAKGSYEAGGDPSRIVGDRMFRRAQRTQRCPGIMTPAESADLPWQEKAATSISMEDDLSRSRQDSVDTTTPVDTALEEFERMFSTTAKTGRPRVVRKHRHVYSVGKTSALPKEKQHNDDSEEDSSDDEDMFRQVFQQFASRRVIRYDNHCYNVGTSKEALLQYYLENRDVLDSAIDVSSSPRAPLIVDCVFDDGEEDQGNFAAPLLALGERESTVPADMSEALHSTIDIAGRRRSTFGDFPEIYFEETNHDTCDERRTGNPQLLGADLSGSTGTRFGALKPAPPMNMTVMREQQEKLQQLDEERRERARLAAPRRSIGSAGLPPPSVSAPSTFRMQRGSSGGYSRSEAARVPKPPTAARKRAQTARSTRRRQHNPFSGQLLQWIDAFMKKDGMISPTQLSKIQGSIQQPRTSDDPVLHSEVACTPELRKSGSRRRGSAVSIRDPGSPVATEARDTISSGQEE